MAKQTIGLGRRKTAVARVYLRPGKGSWEINGRPLAHLRREVDAMLFEEGGGGRTAVEVTPRGSGPALESSETRPETTGARWRPTWTSVASAARRACSISSPRPAFALPSMPN